MEVPYFITLGVLAVLVILISFKTPMLRNELFNEENFCKVAAENKLKNPRPSFSLGRAQLAFWTVIVIGSFIAVVIYKSIDAGTLIIPKIDPVNIALLSIAMGTTVVAKVIDNSQKDSQGEAIPQQDYPSKGFLADIISDEKGVSIHRLQNVIWTIVVGGIYIAYVFEKSMLPDSTTITPQLLSLMGISTGAYLGLKLNENKNPPVNEASKSVAPPADSEDALPPPPPPVETESMTY